MIYQHQCYQVTSQNNVYARLYLFIFNGNLKIFFSKSKPCFQITFIDLYSYYSWTQKRLRKKVTKEPGKS